MSAGGEILYEEFLKPLGLTANALAKAIRVPPNRIGTLRRGKTYGSRLLTVVFTVRANRIRVISARPMSRNERKVYEKED